MTEIENLKLFRQCYGDLHDALLWSFSYQYSRKYDKPNLEMEVQCQRFDEAGTSIWQNLKLCFSLVQEFCFLEKINTTNQVFFAVNYSIDKGQYHFDFDYATDDALDVEYMRKNSSFHVTCKEFTYSVLNDIG